MRIHRGFYFPIIVLSTLFDDGEGVFSKAKFYKTTCDLVHFYKGGVTFEFLKTATFEEIYYINKEANRINKEIAKANKG